MSKLHPLFAVALLAALTGQAVAQKAEGPSKKLYCWNENGRKVCGDALPANAVNDARTEISARSGMATGRVDRALTDAERAALAQAAVAEQAAKDAEEARKRREMAMVESYNSEADLRRAYENRLSLSAGTLKASRMAVDGLRQSLLSLLRRAGENELSGQPVAKPLADSITSQHGALSHQAQLLAQQEVEAGQIQGEFDDALVRYRALKSGAAETAGTATTSPTHAGG